MGGSNSALVACTCGRNILNINERRYYFQDNIGEGAFSYVDLIEGKKDGQFYAVKRIICHDDKAKEEALEEVEYCRKFHHENIIPLVDHCIVNKSRLTEVWLVLPYHKRGTLWDEYQRYSSRKEWIEARRVLRLFYGICRAIEVFHIHKPEALAHRDLKPANVLLTDDDVPVLMDLGSVAVAKVKVENSRDALSLQSLGCILFSLMCLEGPFDKAWMKKDSVSLAVQNRRLDYPENIPYPQSFKDLVNDLMVLDPATRPNIEWALLQVQELRNSQMGIV